MALSVLFLRNAELCSEMASAAKSLEIREQWLELANKWQQKAEADQSLAGTPTSRPALVPSPERQERRQNEERNKEPAQLPTLAPTLVPSKPQLPTIEPSSKLTMETDNGSDSAANELWSQLIAAIRTKRP